MNCLTYAFRKWLDVGGYLIVRRSQFSALFNLPRKHPLYWVPHFLHRDYQHNITQFMPTEEQKAEHLRMGPWRTWLHLWSFRGEVRGDDQPKELT